MFVVRIAQKAERRYVKKYTILVFSVVVYILTTMS